MALKAGDASTWVEIPSALPGAWIRAQADRDVAKASVTFQYAAEDKRATERDGLWQVLDVLKLRIVSFVGQSEPMAASDSVDRRGPLVDGEHLAHHLRIGRGLLANERLSNQNLAVFKIDVFQL